MSLFEVKMDANFGIVHVTVESSKDVVPRRLIEKLAFDVVYALGLYERSLTILLRFS